MLKELGTEFEWLDDGACELYWLQCCSFITIMRFILHLATGIKFSDLIEHMID